MKRKHEVRLTNLVSGLVLGYTVTDQFVGQIWVQVMRFTLKVLMHFIDGYTDLTSPLCMARKTYFDMTSGNDGYFV